MKKNKHRQKMRKLPLLLGLLLLISIVAYGTRAYFTESAKTETGIKLTMGHLKIESVKDKGWLYLNSGTEKNTQLDLGQSSEGYIEEEKAKDLKFVQPGDKFRREFIFKNVGNLAQTISVDHTVKAKEGFTVAFYEKNKQPQAYTKTLSPQSQVTYVMEIAVPEDLNVQMAGKEFDAIGDDAQTEDLIENAITVTATQTND